MNQSSSNTGSSAPQAMNLILGFWGVRYQVRDVSRSIETPPSRPPLVAERMFDRNAPLLHSTTSLLSWRRLTLRRHAIDLRLRAEPVLEFVTRRELTCLGTQIRRSRNHLVVSLGVNVRRRLMGRDLGRSCAADKRARRCRRH